MDLRSVFPVTSFTTFPVQVPEGGANPDFLTIGVGGLLWQYCCSFRSPLRALITAHLSLHIRDYVLSYNGPISSLDRSNPPKHTSRHTALI